MEKNEVIELSNELTYRQYLMDRGKIRELFHKMAVPEAFNDYDDVRFRDFSENEIGQYLQYQKRIDQNLSRILSPMEIKK